MIPIIRIFKSLLFAGILVITTEGGYLDLFCFSFPAFHFQQQPEKKEHRRQDKRINRSLASSFKQLSSNTDKRLGSIDDQRNVYLHALPILRQDQDSTGMHSRMGSKGESINPRQIQGMSFRGTVTFTFKSSPGNWQSRGGLFIQYRWEQKQAPVPGLTMDQPESVSQSLWHQKSYLTPKRGSRKGLLQPTTESGSVECFLSTLQWGDGVAWLRELWS